MSLLRDLHPSRDFERYDVISSWGGYVTVVEQRKDPPRPDTGRPRATFQPVEPTPRKYLHAWQQKRFGR